MNISQSTLYNIGTDYYSAPSKDNENSKLQTSQEKTDSSEKLDKDNKEPKKSNNELSLDEKKQISELQARDTEVRAHESAHQAAGGGMTGGASFTYQKGPDGRTYAIGGEVPISMPSGSTPEEIISNAQQVITAALAPADPSAQDMSVASSARALMINAQQEKMKETNQKNDPSKKEDSKEEDEYMLDTYA